MRRLVYLLLFFILSFTTGCEEEFEPVQVDPESEFQPLSVGNFWIYEVEETIYFGENDFETSNFFYRDRIRGTYLDSELRLVFIVERSKSNDRNTWTKQLEYTLQIRDKLLIRNTNNKPVIALNFPPFMGKKWNGLAFQALGKDEFEIDSVASVGSGVDQSFDLVRVNQEELDDKVTQRDVRFELFQRNIGLVEKYDEVLTYCSRNNCLGQQIIDGGSKVRLKLIEYDIR
ncbi:hypothetical protein [Algoriphagus sp. AK58]|uniref:hypothetical protein n=1 Tax=Algoriphagus sp. AK58 TaxID=1406877 RepID=UPI0016505041|nr:hypothetical protein [Algoriphagus sp. AK58]MBC6367884.1 hypothetical protein [Algoriphagus sp. AK58]